MSQPVTGRSHDGRTRTAAPDLRLEYRGFRNTGQLREYFVHASIQGEHRDYVVTIEQAAFNERRVGFQDGPDICFQRVMRELSGGLRPEGGLLAISDAELADYRAAHAPVARGRKTGGSPVPAGEAAAEAEAGPTEGGAADAPPASDETGSEG